MNVLLLAAPALLGLQASGPADQLIVDTGIHVPDAIGPAIGPYVECFTNAVGEGSQRAGPLHADGMRQVVTRAKTECARARARARTEAVRLIARDSSIAAGNREAEVDRVLADIDHMGDTLVERIAREDGPSPAAATLPVGAVEIPNAIAPVVDRYSRCIRRQMESRHALPAIRQATYRRDVDASIAACASVRESAVAESETVLARASDYRDPARRAQAIRLAFDGTDYQQRELLSIMDAIRRERGN